MDNITKDRDKYIGGSDIPKIMTEPNLYKLALEKLNPTFEGNQYTYYGQFMEPIIREYINNDHNFQPDTVYDGIYRGNCDGVDYKAGQLLEIKTFGANFDVNYYLPQVQTYMHIFDVDLCMLVGYQRPHNFFFWGDITNPQSYNLDFDEKRLDIYYAARSKSDWKKINQKASSFYKGLEALKHNSQLSEIQFNTIVFGSQLVEMVEKWQDPKKVEKLLIDQNIYNANIGNVYIKRTDVTDFGIDVKRLMVERPDVFEEYKTLERSTKIEIRRKR